MLENFIQIYDIHIGMWNHIIKIKTFFFFFFFFLAYVPLLLFCTLTFPIKLNHMIVLINAI